MKWMSNLVSGYVRTFNFVIICLLVLGLMVGGHEVTSNTGEWIVKVFHSPFSLVRNTVVDLARVADDNTRLRLVLRETTLQLTRFEEIERENERLRGILDYKLPLGHDLLQARVLSVSRAVGPVSASINRGSLDSVRVDMPVINEQGLIGRVISVGDKISQIQLLTDPSHRVAARVADTREMGIVKYSNREGMVLDNFPIQGEIRIGDQIMSSGLGGIYPAGLVIGVVSLVERPEEATFCRVRIEPAANFNSIEELFVLRALQP